MTDPAAHTLGSSLLGLRVGLPSTIANRTVPEGVVATYVPSRSGRPETRPLKRKRFGPLRAGTRSLPALRQTGATCLSRIAVRPAVDARNASRTVGLRLGTARPDDRLGPAPLEVCPLDPPAAGVGDEPAGATTAGA